MTRPRFGRRKRGKTGGGQIKNKIKPMVDAAMSIGLFAAMSYQFMEQEHHEIAGAVMLVLLILHHALNLNWFRQLGKGARTAQRRFMTAVDLAVLITVLLVMVSGIRMSRSVFAWLDLRLLPIEVARNIHMSASYLSFLLMSVHIGLHFGMMQGIARRLLGIHTKNKYRTWGLRTVNGCIAAYGLYALVKRRFLSYITLKLHFVLFDFEEPVLYYELDLLAIMILMGSIGYYTQRWLGKKNRRTKEIAG